MKTICRSAAVLAAMAAFGLAAGAHAELVLSQVVVDLGPGKPAREDIEVFNSGDERMYVAAQPFTIVNPGAPDQQREPAVDPDRSGILVTPQKLVLEPGERRLIRIAATQPRPATDKIYRVTIKPVAGEVSASTSALKVFVGYDTLVIYRPETIGGAVEGQRSGGQLVLTNNSNTAQELFDGKQCDAAGANCQALASKRLYPGGTLTQALPYDTKVTYQIGIGDKVSSVTF